MSRLDEAEKITERYVMWSMGGGLIPLPVLDLVAIVGTQIKMLAEISDLYDIPFSENRAKIILVPLISSVGLAPAGAMLLGSLAKVVPVVGQAVGGVAMPVFAGGITLATSRIFVAHFESGGSVLDFEPEEFKESFRQSFEAAKEATGNLSKKVRATDIDAAKLTIDGEPIIPPFFASAADGKSSGEKKPKTRETKVVSKKRAVKKKTSKKKTSGGEKKAGAGSDSVSVTAKVKKKKVPPFRRKKV